MATVLITGASGFVGRNLVAVLERTEGVELLEYDVDNTLAELQSYVQRADFVFHLAGVNRPQDVAEFASGNQGFTAQLLTLLQDSGRATPVVLTSTIQAALDNPYGVSKKGAEDAVFAYGEATGASVYVYRLPNLFGKWCRPNYNSVVATWCHNVARDLPIQINNPTSVMNLAYIDDVVTEMIGALNGQAHPGDDGFCLVPRTFRVTLQQLSGLLHSFRDSRRTLVLPDLSDDFTRFLYATYLSYLPEDEFGYSLEMKHDNRGWLAEFIKSRQFGQVFISRTKPGITRGNHWHHTKVEKFLVVAGDAVIRFRQINSSDVIEYEVTGDELRVLDIPPGYTHSITNMGKSDVITLFWADEIFNPAQPDTCYLEV